MDSILPGSAAKPCPRARPVGVGLSSVARAISSRCTTFKLSTRNYGNTISTRFTNIRLRCTTEKRNVLLKSNRKQQIVASAGRSLDSGSGTYSSRNTWDSLRSTLDAFYRFSRPHTIIGTALSIFSISLVAIERPSDFSPIFVIGTLEAIVAALLMNVYIVGLNQLTDIEIDKVNKPYLPLASGEYSVGTGVFIVTSVAMLSFWISSIVGSWPLFWALFIGFVLGTAYSVDLPMLRWKRFPLLAAMSIVTVRAVVIQIAFFLHMQAHVFARPAQLSKPVIFATAFVSLFSTVIALFKDIPDLEGDRKFGIKSLTVRLGQKRVFWSCILLLQMAYAVAVAVGITSNFLWSKALTVASHVALAAVLWSRAKSTDLSSKEEIVSFYMFIWKLFYAEYILIPFVR